MRNRLSFTDLLFLLMFGLVILVGAMYPHINPPSEEAIAQDPPGNVMVMAEWREGNIDVDVWMLGPGEPRPVGYSNKSGRLWNLLRDDLGTRPDSTPSNFEHGYSRGIVPGEYVINVHCYKCHGLVPVEVHVEISIKKKDPTSSTGNDIIDIIAERDVTLLVDKQEITVLRFELDAEGVIQPGSKNSIYRPMKNTMHSNPSPTNPVDYGDVD